MVALELFLALCLSCGYILNLLVLKKLYFGGEGPFINEKRVIVWQNQEFKSGAKLDSHKQAFGLFDYLRNALGTYLYLGDGKYSVKSKAIASVFQCPKCLSFYISIPFAGFYLYQMQMNFYWMIVFWPAIAMGALVLYNAVNE